MTFRHEAEMQAPVHQWLRTQGLETKTEFATPWGVCDLVGASFNPASVAKRLAHGQREAIGPPSRVALLQAIPDHEGPSFVTFHGLARRFACLMPPDRLREELFRLMAARFVITPRRNAFQRLNGWLPLHRRIVAVELKLTRVMEVMNQARSHLAFASESYVALPHDLAVRVRDDDRGRALAASGLGLLAVRHSECTVLTAPQNQTAEVDRVLQLAFLERFWKRYLTNNSS